MGPPDEAPARAVPLQVLHLSMPRTGSVSMKAAYEILGLPTYHGFDFIEHSGDQIQWATAVDAKFRGIGKPFGRAEFDSFLGSYAVLSDFPVIGFWDDLVRSYPEAKVVLVDRDLDKWEHSFVTQVVPANFTVLATILRRGIEPFINVRPASTIWTFEQHYFHCHDRDSFAANARPTYVEHYAQVRKTVPRDRLLNYKLGSGWEPLCEFLGKPVPDVEFPHLNESTEFALWMAKIQRRKFAEGMGLLGRLMGRYVMPLAGLWLGLWWIRRASSR